MTKMHSLSGAEAADLLSEIRELMLLNGENPFKVRAFEKASDLVREATDLAERARAGTLTELPGIGKGIAQVLTERVTTGESQTLIDLKKALPVGLLELTQVPGLGPKKALQVIKELEITSLAELEYACRENRLTKLSGFGEKVQKKILEGLLFLKTTQGLKLLPDAFREAEIVLKNLAHEWARLDARCAAARLSEVGELRRRMETISTLEFLLEIPETISAAEEKKLRAAMEGFKGEGLPVKLHYARPDAFGYEQARLTATEAHWKKLEGGKKPLAITARSEEVFYADAGYKEVPPPETRETGEELDLLRKGELDLLAWDGVKGIFHNHTLASDGTETLETMVKRAHELGYTYIGISDHSQSAFYAQGLKPDTLKAQERELRTVQEKYPDIRIFWGVESDILADGGLDYDESVLERFDFVIASIHSRFGMDEKAMTDRIIKAIRHPRTRFIGHLTGRILLGRAPYALDLERVINAAAEHDVCIELNASPQRLDVDWRNGPLLRAAGTRISINPDAHDLEGLEDTRYGIAMARKALMPARLVVNSMPTEKVAAWLARN